MSLLSLTLASALFSLGLLDPLIGWLVRMVEADFFVRG
jgi:hypothetical protein